MRSSKESEAFREIAFTVNGLLVRVAQAAAFHSC